MKHTRRPAVLALAVLAAAAVWYALARHAHAPDHAPSVAPTDEVAASAPTGAPQMPVVAAASSEAEPARSAASVAPPAPPSAMDEPSLMALLRSASGNDPALAVELAREGNRRFPDSADAPERASILIHALAELGESSAARGEAETMVNHYPDSRWVRDIELFTGAHRHRNVVLDDQGRLKFVDPPPG